MKRIILIYTQGWVLCSIAAFLFSDVLWMCMSKADIGILAFCKELLISLLYMFVYSNFTLILTNLVLNMVSGSMLKHPRQRIFVGVGLLLVNLCSFGYTAYLNYQIQPSGDIQKFWFTIMLTLAFTSVFTFIYSFGILVEEISKSEKMKISILKSQLKPHFVFNSLNTLAYLISEDARKAEDYTVFLSKIFRYQIKNLDHDFTPVSEALDEAECLMQLYQIRFPDGICLEVQPQLYLQKSCVLSMSFQVLFENIIKHNEISSLHPVVISIFQEGDFVSVSNTVSAQRPDKVESFGIGLENLKQRYQVLTGKTPVITRENHTFKVQLPIIY